MNADDAGEDEYASEVGARLRRTRNQQGLTLQDVDERSGGRFKAAIVGAYERGDRKLSIDRLIALAGFYAVPITELLPSTLVPEPRPPIDGPVGRTVLDVRRVRELSPDVSGLLQRYVSRIQQQRGEFSATMALRADDLLALATMYDTTVPELVRRWTRLGIAVSPADPAIPRQAPGRRAADP
jgi:transcriptional regulator with XRE-family HTH domain